MITAGPQTWTERATLPAPPEQVLELLTEPDAIARWAPVPFDVVELPDGRLIAGSRARVRGRLAGRGVEFAVNVIQADTGLLALVADGPISLEVEYQLRAQEQGSELQASVSVHGSGLRGRLLAAATDALLAAGALAASLARLERELRPSVAAATC